MPARSSRLSGFYRLTVEERRQALKEATDLSEEAVEALASADALSEEAADHMIENVVGRFVLPVGWPRISSSMARSTSFPSSWKSPVWWQQPPTWHGDAGQLVVS